jgi:tRNA threonylcarbamoyladenosine biosynthesis protein TsaE
MNFPFTKNITSEKETKQVAKEFASVLRGGDIVLLEGNLGAGKTFFVKEVCGYFNITEASSPTFALVNEYYGDYKIYHFDFYRIKKINELFDIGIDDYLSDEDAIKFIEWAELFPDAVLDYNFLVKITLSQNGEREIVIGKQ